MKKFHWLSAPLILFILISACTEDNKNENEDISPTATPETPTENTMPVEIVGDCVVEGNFPDGATCITVSITCEGLPAAMADLRVTPNSPGTTYAGTVVFGSGGTGRSFLSGNAPLPGLPSLNIVHQLVNAGYKVIERKWQDGWFGEGSEGFGVIAPSCRHAELLKWLHDQETAPGPMCAFGNSAGASEIAYGLTRWNTEEILDAVILGAGPPMTRLDTGCLGYDHEPSWQQTCTEVWNNTQTQCGSQSPVCTLSERESATGPQEIDAAFSIAGLNDLCTGSSATFSEVFLENSVLFPGADVDYPNTGVHFLFGRQDCTESVALGTLYLDAITTEKSVTYLEDVPHKIQGTEPGANAIISTVIENCTIDP